MIEKQEKAGIGRAVVGVLFFYALALLLNGSALEREARLMPYGRTQDVVLALVRPVAVLSELGPGLLRAKTEQVMEEQAERL